ncbi:hypothetical protein [Methylobacterium sp. ID0610]|uniref:hypothetical protein n=1 Tax=Methylobacterium carpenticola TaxID=3344827 RepID=UPI00369D08F5
MIQRAAPPFEMPVYRAYRLTPGGGVQPALILEAEDDETARAMAARLSNPHGLELWERDRLLARFPPRDPAAQERELS